MSKYTDILSNVETQFATAEWKATTILAYPVNYTVPTDKSEFVKIEVLHLEGNTSYGRAGISGKLIIQIYVKVNQGSKRLMEIADLLDTLLQNKRLGNGTDTSESSLAILGVDQDIPDLFRGDYVLDFNHFN
jgi:hypothetical protein